MDRNDPSGRIGGQEDRGRHEGAPGFDVDRGADDGDREPEPQTRLLPSDAPKGWAPGTPIGHPDRGSTLREQTAERAAAQIERSREDQLPSWLARDGQAGGEERRSGDLGGPGSSASAYPYAPGTARSWGRAAEPGPDRAGGGAAGTQPLGSGSGAYRLSAPTTALPGSRWTVPPGAVPVAGDRVFHQPWASPATWSSPPPPAPRVLSKGWLGLLLIASLLSAAVGAGVGAVVTQNSQKTIVEKFFPNRSVLARPQDVQEVLAKVLPAVVSVSTQNVRPASTLGGGNFVEGAGTGMIITSGGEVLTNNHVVAGATSVAVTLYRQTEQRQATVISTDPANDLALIKINGVSGLPRVNFGNSATVQQGDSVLAIGNALALAGGPTVTEGIVSALGRSLRARDPVTLASEHLTGLIQTDAPINPGNSGGPLVSSNGNVIGMNTAVATSSTGNAPAENVGFAIAVNTIKALLPQLRRSNITVTPASAGGYMGVVVTDATPVVREQMGIVAHSGAVVISVGPGSPAQRAGIRSADVIVAVNNTPVATAADLAKILKRLRPGDRVAVTLERGGRRLQVQVVLEARPGYVP